MGLIWNTHKDNAALDWSYEQKKMDKQQDQWFEQFNAVNDYNDPARQLQRLYDADINPLFGGGSDFAGMSSASPSSPSGGFSAPEGVHALDYLQTGLKGFKDAADALLQYRASQRADVSLENDTRRANAEVAKSGSEARFMDRREKSLAIHDTIDVNKAADELKSIQASTEKTKADTDYARQLISNSLRQLDQEDRKIDAMLSEIDESIRHNKQMESVAFKQANTDAYAASELAGYHSGMLGIEQQNADTKQLDVQNQFELGKKGNELREKELQQKYEQMTAQQIADDLDKGRQKFLGLTTGYNSKFVSESRALRLAAQNKLRNMDPNDPEAAPLLKAYSNYVYDMEKQVTKEWRRNHREANDPSIWYDSPVPGITPFDNQVPD